MRRRQYLILGFLGVALGALNSPAQTSGSVSPTTPTTTTTRERTGIVVGGDQPTYADPIREANIVGAFTPADRPTLPPEVVRRLERFKLDARAYVEKEQALKKRLLGANDADRARVREQLRAARKEWLENSRRVREELKDRLPELRARLKDHQEVLDAARGAARDQQQELRKRRATENQ